MGFVENGFIQVPTIIEGGGCDENGDAVPSNILGWSDPVPCHIDTLTHRNDGRYINGKFTRSSYRVFFEMYDISQKLLSSEAGNLVISEDGLFSIYGSGDYTFGALRVRLIHNGRDLGEWQVQDSQYKPKTGRIQVTV